MDWEGDTDTTKILEGETFRLVYVQKFRSGCVASGEGKQDDIVSSS